MIPITSADREKWLIRIGMDWVRKHYADGKNSKEISDDIENCGNPVIRFFNNLLKRARSNISEKHQKKMIKDFGEFGLWVMYEDTAYRQIFFWLLKQAFDNKDTLMPLVEKYYVEPEDWYVNQWGTSKRITKEKQEKGELPKGELSEAEKYYVPAVTQARNKKIVEELEKQRKRKGI